MPLTQKPLSQPLEAWLNNAGYSLENLNQPGENGDSALMKLTREGRLDWMQELLAVGVEVNLRNNDGNNALWFACFGNFYAAIDLLLDAGVNIDNQNDNGATALMYAASAGKGEVLQQLLDRGADVSLKNLDDFTALDFASTEAVWRQLKHAAK